MNVFSSRMDHPSNSVAVGRAQVRRRSSRGGLLALACWLCPTSALLAGPWIDRPVPVFAQEPTQQLNAVVYAQGRFVAQVDQRLHHSPDGVVWTPAPWAHATLGDLRVVGGVFFHAVDREIFTSPTGLYWDRFMVLPEFAAGNAGGSSQTWATDGEGGLAVQSRQVAAGDVMFAEVRLWRTADRVAWTAAGALPGVTATSSVVASRLVGANGRYLLHYVVGDRNAPGAATVRYTVVSTDGGATWTTSDLPAEAEIARLVYGNGWYVAVAADGRLWRSKDGRAFLAVNHVLPAGFDRQIHFAGGWFVTRSAGTPNTLLASVDGLAWQDLGAIPYARIDSLQGVALGQGQLVAVGRATRLAGQAAGPFLMSSTQAAPAVVRSHPVDTRIAATRRLQLAVALETPAAPATTYRWTRDGVVLGGQTSAQLTVANLSAADAGVYRCLITNAAGTVASDEAQVTVIDPAAGGRLSNLSVLSRVTAGDAGVQVGFVVHGAAAKPVLVRAVGPTLTQFDVAEALPDPVIALMHQGAQVGANDNWSGTDGRELGAFPLPVGSADAVVPAALGAGAYSAVVKNAQPRAGRVLTEVYDDRLNDGVNRLANVSARARVEAGATLIAGFVVTGETPLPVVIRGIGPTLAAHGVTAPVANPRLTLYRADGAPIAFNDDWLDDDGRGVGAFALPAGSADAVLRVTLPAGAYTAHVTAGDAAPNAGEVLIEVYDAL